MNDISTSILRYKLDSENSKFTVQAFAAGFLAGFGHDSIIGIRDFSGEIQFSPETFVNASLHFVVNAKSLAVLNDIKEKDKQEIERTMQEKVLETSLFPEITFQSTNVTVSRIIPGRWKAKIIGDLNLHGETRSLWIMSQLTLDGDELRTKGDFTLRQTEYGIKLVSVAAGALKLKDELKFEFDLLGCQTEE